MRSKWRLSEILVVFVALALPFKAGGCGRTACITVSASQLQSGMCPSADKAMSRFDSAACDGLAPPVASVDGPGAIDGDLCCYPVTESSDNAEFGSPACGVGGSPSTNVSVGVGVSTSVGVGVGVGGNTTASGCVSCKTALQGAPFSQVCQGPASDALQALRACACASNCTAQCDATLCFGNLPDNACQTCVNSACSSELMTCQGG
jgi:hypothetical protein